MEKEYMLFADTDCDITPQFAKEYNCGLISMPYSLNGVEVFPYQTTPTFDFEKFYAELRSGAIPTTRGLNPSVYEGYFEPVLKSGKDILYVHFSRAMSGTFAAMDLAIKNLRQKYPDRKICTIDTKGITVCAYAIILEIADLYKAGATMEQLLDWARQEVNKFATYYFVNDLKFLKRGGKVKGVAAFIGNFFGIRPILTMDSNGIMKGVGKVRGLSGAIAKLIEITEKLGEDIKDHKIVIAHSDTLATAQVVEKELREKYGSDLEIDMHLVNPTSACHCGPDGVGITFHAKHR
ncbi:MAG: DegV family protein [Clostridia bacterium]|nr:DegV family protein [Clostridia bacterium]